MTEKRTILWIFLLHKQKREDGGGVLSWSKKKKKDFYELKKKSGGTTLLLLSLLGVGCLFFFGFCFGHLIEGVLLLPF